MCPIFTDAELRRLRDQMLDSLRDAIRALVVEDAQVQAMRRQSVWWLQWLAQRPEPLRKPEHRCHRPHRVLALAHPIQSRRHKRKRWLQNLRSEA